MDPDFILDLANQAIKLRMYPFFDIAHCAITCMYVREDLASGAQVFSRKHPLACWISSMFSIYAGAILSGVLLAEPVLTPFNNNNQVILATIVWYLIFYSPFDIVYKVCKFLPIKLILASFKEIYRCKKVHDGVVHAAKIYPNGYLIMIIIGAVKGNGSNFTKIFERLLRGIWTPAAIEILQPGLPAKTAVVAAVIFVLDKKTEFITAPQALVYLGIILFFVYFKLTSLLLGIDHFVPFENLFCALFLGGFWDALSKAFTTSKNETAAIKIDGAKNGKSDSAKKKD
ncbi:Trimeric intracellular cation channel type 1B.1 [Nymphon striatum]|nr:Trimeric intracellular cation channel type 1B.1 [Nymphon striatum]KAG1677499.1 Trimeric intracellular cation channel type 1B.1 [Nymphon striatum]